MYVYIYTLTYREYVYIPLQIHCYYRLLQVLCIGACAVQKDLVVYLRYIQTCASVNPNLLIDPPQPSLWNFVAIRLLSMSVSRFRFCIIFLIFHI